MGCEGEDTGKIVVEKGGGFCGWMGADGAKGGKSELEWPWDIFWEVGREEAEGSKEGG